MNSLILISPYKGSGFNPILSGNNTSDSFRSSRASETLTDHMLDYFFNV
ncbi:MULTISPECIES: hypothetical protein [unclassified Microcoleus]|nr:MULTISPECIES: hypothetical protein [unclassified Microcoleus]MCC3445096.1 hypothetical protein [Microcoleus sp. PH2017_03_ELD_O_A]MCC3467250.1 hypothetical protein [Microcoleus sp. PH2017_06_SFM_O_A]MCC3504909.1 hypothetical protein [Microcoleus sp. PH2017_19_SFW_U_A]MCC3509616.1 hypothetical protein [Microcoleus sp. PH2017_17_BER_D_A]MCC3524703.1 hypothetical protein [Microcoleus sp. PH2017_20_SFW_D_A]MCC3548475.1 hypothetical protein [Microcoleus sp. PH2017_24_DOB_U_A]MCC3555438.1 hypot